MAAVSLGLMMIGVNPSSARAAQPFRVSLKLVPSETFPAMPVALCFTVTNNGAADAPFPRRAELIVRTDRGEEFVTWGNTRELLQLRDWPATIGKGETKVLCLRTDGTFQKPEWLQDSRLFRSGRYELQAFFDDSFIPSEGIGGPATTIDQVRQASVSSTAAVLTVHEPTGADADAWQLMNSGRGWHHNYLLGDAGRRLAQQVVKAYPLSAYAGWIAATGAKGSALDRAEMLRAWLERAPADAYTEWRQWRLAVFEIGASAEIGRRDAQKSAALRAAAGAILNRLVRDTADAEVKELAKNSLEFVESREQEERSRN